MNKMNVICKNEKCRATNSIFKNNEAGRIECNKCGIIYEEDIIANEYEERAYEEDKDRIKRIGHTEKPGQKPETTVVVKQIGKTKITNKYSKKTKIDKNSKKIEKVLSSVDVSKRLIEKTKKLYSIIAPHKNMQGRNFNHIIIALYYYAKKVEDEAITFRDITKIFPSIKEREITKACNYIKECIPDNTSEEELIKFEQNFIHLYIGKNQEKYDAKMLAYEIIKKINKNSLLEGKNPKTVAGLSLLLSFKLLNENIDNREKFFSTFSNKATLSKTFKEIKNSLEKIIPEKYSDQIEKIKNSKI